MNIVSLFDGISVARYALDVAGIPVAKYYSAEICPHAIKVSDKNYPNIIRLGDVKNVQSATITEPIDLLIGGSPCQDLSIAGKRKGLAGERSGLFYEYVRIKNELKPKHFILENVYSMSSVDRDIITGILGVEPVMFNASLVSAQSRKRLFWTDIKFDLPQDKGIILKDILQACSDIDPKMVNPYGKSYTLTATYSKVSASPNQVENSREKKQRTMVLDTSKPIKVGIVNGGESVALSDSQGNRVYSDDGKSVTLSAHGGGAGAKTGLYQIKTLTTVSKDNVVVNQDYNVRKLTPIECERLQSLPDDYTEGVAKTHRYKCLGNAFNAEVIAHILKSGDFKKLN
jgi:DNA (cytosine-5)-methyltransferase 3A